MGLVVESALVRCVYGLMDVALLEGIAVATYERLDFDPCKPVSTIALAKKLLGAGAVIRPAWMTLPAALYRHDGAPRIAVRRGIPIEYALFYCGHELAHVLLEQERYSENDVEQACDYLAGSLMAPRPAMRGLQRTFGFDYEEIADAVCATQSWAALRLSEVSGQPTALVAPQRVRIRGDEWGWPRTEDQLRKLSQLPALPGVRRSRLTDDKRRIVMVAEDAEAA